MITLHRLGHPNEELYVNHDMIVTVVANPDTVITLRDGEKIVVADPPEAVAEKVLNSRAEVLALAFSGRYTSSAGTPPGTTHGDLHAVPAEGSH
jgi:uncharacterized protein YlzI (FlbEa/FlbD family)